MRWLPAQVGKHATEAHAATFDGHRGHAVFDTVKLVEGHLYQLEDHLNRLLASAEKAGLNPPKSVDQMYRTILETAAASCVATGTLDPARVPWTLWIAPSLNCVDHVLCCTHDIKSASDLSCFVSRARVCFLSLHVE